MLFSSRNMIIFVQASCIVAFVPMITETLREISKLLVTSNIGLEEANRHEFKISMKYLSKMVRCDHVKDCDSSIWIQLDE